MVTVIGVLRHRRNKSLTTLRDFLSSHHREEPEWLRKYPKSELGTLTTQSNGELVKNLLNSNPVFYPGAGYDRGPIAAFNSARASQCFVYVDYGVSREELLANLKEGVGGYTSAARIELSKVDFPEGIWNQLFPKRHDAKPSAVSPYAFIEIFERKLGYSEDHGSIRFAVLFLAADGFVAFDALFCRTKRLAPPLCIVLQDHGFGGNYDKFGRDGLLEKIATESKIKPEFLLVAENTKPWKDYTKIQNIDGENMGMHSMPRHIYRI